MASRLPLTIEVLRGSIVESQHQVMIVVVNEIGNVSQYWGHPQFLTVPRSAIKMLQALPIIESGAADKYMFDDRELAMMCSSHTGEKDHLTVLQELTTKLSIPESTFVCAPHLPYNEASAHEMIRRGAKPTTLCNNCAGKHIGIIATCLHLGEDPKGYDKYDHPAQKLLRRTLGEVMHFDHTKTAYGIDGCGIPTYGVPLQSLAAGMASLINSKETAPRKAAAERLLRAVKAFPFYVGGSGTFVTDVIEKTQGRAIIKSGAEGVYCGVLPEKRVAFAIKAADGAARAAQFATASLLLQLGGLTESEFKALAKHTMPAITNWKGDVVGQIRIAKPA